MKLSAWAKKQGVSYGCALKWFHNGNLPVASHQLSSGTILVDPYELSNAFEEKKVYVYARVSSANKKDDLNTQASLCEQFCINKGWKIEKVFKEIASGMNDNRKKLNLLLDMDNIIIVSLHKDRLTRFGFNYIQKCINSNSGEIVIINKEQTDEDDLLKDFIAIITSFCCRLYGARRGQYKALKMKENLAE